VIPFDLSTDDEEDARLYEPRRRCDEPLPAVPQRQQGQEPAWRAFELLIWQLQSTCSADEPTQAGEDRLLAHPDGETTGRRESGG
jgi:hypothetical protein